MLKGPNALLQLMLRVAVCALLAGAPLPHPLIWHAWQDFHPRLLSCHAPRTLQRVEGLR